jgi:hypothetical protein
VPITVPWIVPTVSSAEGSGVTARRLSGLSTDVSTTFASPQSSTYTSPKSPTMMLSGLRSRWMTPRACANSMARHTLANAVSSLWRVHSRTVAGTPPCSSPMTCSSVLPSTRRIVKYALPFASRPRSYTGTIDGCSS